jgi:Na+/H+ antiporter NhaC
MEWYETIYELIDMRSFSNLWFWIALAVQWSMASHWILGVPFDLVQRARRQGGRAQEDLEALARINVNRLLYISHVSGLWLTGIAAFLLTGLAVLGFFYGLEFAQAVFCLVFPMMLVGALSLRSARRIAEGEHEGEALLRRMLRHRMATQGIGMVSILLTSLWGMWQNLRIGPL